MGPRSLLQEAVNSNQPVEIIAQIARLEGPQRDGPRSVQPWLWGGHWTLITDFGSDSAV